MSCAERIAIYDLDRTITRVPTWTPFLFAALRTRQRWRAVLAPLALAAAMLNAIGLIDRRTLKQFMHRLALGRLTAAQAARLAERFVDDFGARHIRPEARARIAADRTAGYRIVIATAAYDFYAAAFARVLGADALVATRAVRGAAGDILPRIDGENCYGAAKLAMIRAWLSADADTGGNRRIRFYSDHVSDLPTFAWADERFAITPGLALRRLANTEGWTILDWR